MSELKSATKMARLRQYAAMIQERKNRGMTVKEWCEENGIGIKVYYYRQRVVRKALLEMGATELPALTGRAEFAKVPATMVAKPGDKPMTAINVNGVKVDVYDGAAIDVIKDSLKAVIEIC